MWHASLCVSTQNREATAAGGQRMAVNIIWIINNHGSAVKLFLWQHESSACTRHRDLLTFIFSTLWISSFFQKYYRYLRWAHIISTFYKPMGPSIRKYLVVVVADELQAQDLLSVPVLGLGLGAVWRGPRAGAARQQETQTVIRLLQVGGFVWCTYSICSTLFFASFRMIIHLFSLIRLFQVD